jgi:hypothetical protein
MNQFVSNRINDRHFIFALRQFLCDCHRGKRKGFAPIELLSGKKLDEYWCDMLLTLAA